MNDTQIKTLDQIRQFLEGTGVVDLTIDTKEDRYASIQHTLIRFRYRQLSKADKGLLLGFLQKVSGYSRIQIKRLVGQSIKTGKLKRRQRTVKGFTRTYAREDIQLLARTDEVRKHLGYSHIPQRFAPLINTFNQHHLNPYINFHRPCFFPIVITDARANSARPTPTRP